MAKGKRSPAQKRAIKKAQRTWDETHYSRAEGKKPPVLASDGEMFHLVKGSAGACTRARGMANKIREQGYKTRVKELDIKGKKTCLVYKGPRRKKETRVKAGTGPKGHHHAGYGKRLPKWTGYGAREKGGLGRGR